MKRTSLWLATLLLVASPALAADGPAGNWKLKLPAQEGQTALFLFAFTESEGKWVIDFLGTNARIPTEPKIKTTKIMGDSVNFSLTIGTEDFFTFDGVLAKDKKTINGTMSIQGGTPRIVTLNASKLKKAGDAVELAREEFAQLESGKEFFENGFILVGLAAAKKLPIEEIRGVADKVTKAATQYGPKWERMVALRLANTLVSQEGFAEVALAQARRAERMMADDDSPLEQMEILESLVRSLNKSGKADDAKKYNVTLAKLASADATDYFKKNLKFEMPEFKGRQAKSDRVMVVEMFSTSESEGVLGPTFAFDALTKTFKPNDVVFLQYYYHFGDAPDVLANDDIGDRLKSYEKLEGAPAIMINGAELRIRPGAANVARPLYTGLREQLEKGLEKPATVKLALAITKDEKGYSAKATVSEIEKPGDKVMLRFVLVEDRVRYSGNSGIRYHQNVVRAMPGGAKGIAVAKKPFEHTVAINIEEIRAKNLKHLEEIGKKAEFNKPDRPMDLKNLKLIAIVQDEVTNEILNAVQVELDTK